MNADSLLFEASRSKWKDGRGEKLYMAKKWSRRTLIILIITFVSSGCSISSTNKKNHRDVTTDVSDVTTEAQRLKRCSAELEAQKTVNREQYDKQRVEFDRLMSGAAQYATVRGRVDGVTQDTVDAMYRFRVNLLCASINQSVLTNLAERGEREVPTK